jgi:SAM-dependent methyltransferase
VAREGKAGTRFGGNGPSGKEWNLLSMRQILSIPSIYRLFTQLVGGAYRKQYLRDYVRPQNGERVLDIGCGPGDILAHMPEVDYCGLDLDPRYIEAAKKRFGTRGKFLCQRAGDVVCEQPGTFDLVMANGLIHHLSDEEASHTFAVARQLLKPNGRLVTFDNGYVPEQSRLARWIISRDRGQFVRTPEKYRSLAGAAFGKVECHIRHDLLRIPYTHVIMVCSSNAQAA